MKEVWYTFKGDGYEKWYVEFSDRGSYKSCWYRSRTYVAIIGTRGEERRGWAVHLFLYELPSDLSKGCPLIIWRVAHLSLQELPYDIFMSCPSIIIWAAFLSLQGLPFGLFMGCPMIFVRAALLAVNGLPAGKRKQTQCEYWILMYAAYRLSFDLKIRLGLQRIVCW